MTVPPVGMPTPSRSRGMVETDIGRLSVESAGTGPAIVLWPNLFFGALALRDQLEALAGDYHVLLIEPPGHGESDAPRRLVTYDDCAEASMRVLDDAGIENAIFFGASWGGPVAVTAALRFPTRLRALIVMNGVMHAFTRAQRMKYWLMIALYESFGPRDFLTHQVTKLLVSDETRAKYPEREALLVDRLRSADRNGLALALRSVLLSRAPSIAPRLGELHVPTLFLTGGADTVVDVELARAGAHAVVGSRFEVIEGSAHTSGFEAPERVNPLIGDFLRTLDTAH